MAVIAVGLGTPGLDERRASIMGDVMLPVDGNVDAVAEYARDYALWNALLCDGEYLSTTDEVLQLLNAGISQVFVTAALFCSILKADVLEAKDQSRLGLKVQYNSTRASSIVDSNVASNLDPSIVGAPPALIDEESTADSADPVEQVAQDLAQMLRMKGSHPIWLPRIDSLAKSVRRNAPEVKCLVSVQEDVGIETANITQIEATAVVAQTRLTADLVAEPYLFPAARLILDGLRSDRNDGLFPTVVTDESDKCLGLVYSSHESIAEALKTCRGTYYSRSRHGLWRKGEESGNTQELLAITRDCDSDALQFHVRQTGAGESHGHDIGMLNPGFCHLETASCFGNLRGLARLESTLCERRVSAPPSSYTAKLFADSNFLQAKILEEAGELCEASEKKDVAAEMADLLYFALTKCISSDVLLADVERNLDLKALRVTRRKGAAKPQYISNPQNVPQRSVAPVPPTNFNGPIRMRSYQTSSMAPAEVIKLLERPSQRTTDSIMEIVQPIIGEVRRHGDKALLSYTHQFEKATSLTQPCLKAPFPPALMQLDPATESAINVSYDNIRRFHEAQRDAPLRVETMPGVVCSRFSRPIERVGLYVPGGTAVLPSTALMLGVPAMVAGCHKIVLASPPRSDGSLSPEIVYIAAKIGADSIVLAGGAQAVAAMAYGTESVPKVDKILGPGNQFVTAAKMSVSNDTTAGVSIDMPAGPSEVMVIADASAHPAFVASDLLSQAEHGADSQVVLIAVGLENVHLEAIEHELHEQAMSLPRVEIVRKAIEHSVTLQVPNLEEAMRYCNEYAPEHLILQLQNAEQAVEMVMNAGSVFVGAWTPESVGDYSAGVNHSLRGFFLFLSYDDVSLRAYTKIATYGYAKQYSGVNLASFTKHITSSHLTPAGLMNIGDAVMQLASVEALEAHRRAVSIRLQHMR